MTIRIARRSSTRFSCASRSASCISIAALAAPVTLGNSNQWPSPAALMIWPSCSAAWRARKSRWSARSTCRSAASSCRKRAVEPLISVFMTTVVRSGFIVRHRFYALVGLLSLRQFPVHWERNENKHAISKAYHMGSILWLAGLELDHRPNPAWLCLLRQPPPRLGQRNTTLHSAAEEKPAHARGFRRTAALDYRQAALAGASMSLW